jgi:hypothetical protein
MKFEKNVVEYFLRQIFRLRGVANWSKLETHRQMGRRRDIQMDKWTNGQTDKWAGRQTERHTYLYMNKPMDM